MDPNLCMGGSSNSSNWMKISSCWKKIDWPVKRENNFLFCVMSLMRPRNMNAKESEWGSNPNDTRNAKWHDMTPYMKCGKSSRHIKIHFHLVIFGRIWLNNISYRSENSIAGFSDVFPYLSRIQFTHINDIDLEWPCSNGRYSGLSRRTHSDVNPLKVTVHTRSDFPTEKKTFSCIFPCCPKSSPLPMTQRDLFLISVSG